MFVSSTDRLELSGLWRNAGDVSITARSFAPRAARQRAVRFVACGDGDLERAILFSEKAKSERDVECSAKFFVDISRRRHHFHHFAESTRVFISLAVGTFRFCRRARSCSIPM